MIEQWQNFKFILFIPCKLPLFMHRRKFSSKADKYRRCVGNLISTMLQIQKYKWWVKQFLLRKMKCEEC